ncbi:hypothetical protein J7T55_015668 [Diaporthe amygdali]|uniref:uncharacterized protein n=1 Tax=Phomopsis amygdali TaxID=1214568 RepID=UPI0022FDF040|nr:uncharacterized protein J7T55_015668 [Diaporthe amygdali]KAJ0120930.1 hypothetical protein J7T55_015668 [Diaporthe amygdali]
MISTSNSKPCDGIKDAENQVTPSKPQIKLQPMVATSPPLPSQFELLTHLKLLDAIITLKNGINDQAQEKGMEGGKAWDQFCQAAAAKFLGWSENVDVSEETISIPPLDILMIWHTFMLNTKAYAKFEDETLRGRMAGKGIDWKDLKLKLDLDYDGIVDILASWDDVDKPHTLKQGEVSITTDFDMVAAVQRQLKFTEKMFDAAWRHEELVKAFLDSAVDRYVEFFTLIAENPGFSFCPTLAIDLVWHTHQLSPKQYRSYSRQMTNGRFVHHDDNLDESTLNQAAFNAEKIYFEKYGARGRERYRYQAYRSALVLQRMLGHWV